MPLRDGVPSDLPETIAAVRAFAARHTLGGLDLRAMIEEGRR
jgi:hypothetical protein